MDSKNYWRKIKNSIVLVTIFLVTIKYFSSSAQVIPDGWKIVWDAGVRGGIIDRQTIYTNLPAGLSAATIQSAMNLCPSNQVVKLSNGVYNLNGNIKIPTGVTLRGAGMSNSIVTNGVIYFDSPGGYDYTWTANTAVNLANCVKDSFYVTSSVSHGYSVGDYVIIDQLTDITANPPHTIVGSLGTMTWGGRPTGVGNRSMGQFVRITNIVSSTVFMTDRPMYWSYDRTPQAYEISSYVHYAGVEDLTHIGNVSDDANILWQGGINCWLKRVEIRGIKKKAVWGYGRFRSEITECLIHEPIPNDVDKTAGYTSDRVYPIFYGPHAVDNLDYNNITERCTMGVAFEGCASGNVYAYNLMIDIFWNATGDSPRRFGPLNHGSHPFMNLIEGNWSSVRFRADSYWGSSSHYIVLRNRIQQTDRGSSDSQCWTMDIETNTWYCSFWGNVLGGSSSGGFAETKYEESLDDASPYSFDNQGVMWRIGAPNGGGGASAGQLSKAVWTNMIRHANWEYRTNNSVSGSGVTYNVNGNPLVTTSYTIVTNSFYLDSKPAWFGFLTWPPYDPYRDNLNAANTSYTNIPAGYRYAFGTNPPAAGGGGGGDSPYIQGSPKLRGVRIKR